MNQSITRRSAFHARLLVWLIFILFCAACSNPALESSEPISNSSSPIPTPLNIVYNTSSSSVSNTNETIVTSTPTIPPSSLTSLSQSLIVPLAEPEYLRPVSSKQDNISIAALVGPWESSQNRMNTEYGFSDDGFFYKNVMINNSYSIYHPGYTSYGYYYNTYHYGYWDNYYNYTYFDTLIGEYRVKGGVIEFDHVVAIDHTYFEDDWYQVKTRSISLDQLQRESTGAEMRDDFSIEFEFISPSRLRIREGSHDIDLFWDLDEVKHDVDIPDHQIPAVKWPTLALSNEMPLFKTEGRIRQATQNEIPSSDKGGITTTIIIDRTKAINEMREYAKLLQAQSWWVSDLSDTTNDDDYLSFEARQGMFSLYISNGNGSNTISDTIVIESTVFPEGSWPSLWRSSDVLQPNKTSIVGFFNSETDDQGDIYSQIVFDAMDENAITKYAKSLGDKGYKIPQYSYKDWEMFKYIWLDKKLYLLEISLDQRMDNLSSYNYDFEAITIGKWPEIWTKGGLIAAEGYEAIAGEINLDDWKAKMDESNYDYQYVKYLGLDNAELDSYFKKLKQSGFVQTEDNWNNETSFYAYLEIEQNMIRVEISQENNEDIIELSYRFDLQEKGIWPETWRQAGMPSPEGASSILSEINIQEITSKLHEWGYAYIDIEFLGLDETKLSTYFSKLQNLGFRQTEDIWSDEICLYNYLIISGDVCRVEIQRDDNDELIELSFYLQYFPQGEWPATWIEAGIPAPKFKALLSVIDPQDFATSLNEWGYFVKSLIFLDADLDFYLTELRQNGFIEADYYDPEEWILTKRIRIGGKWYEVSVELEENTEVEEIYIRFTDE